MHMEHIYAVAKEMEEWYRWKEEEEEPFTGAELVEMEARLNEVFGADIQDNFTEEIEEGDELNERTREGHDLQREEEEVLVQGGKGVAEVERVQEGRLGGSIGHHRQHTTRDV